MMLNACYRHRHACALATTVGVATLALLAPWTRIRAAAPQVQEAPMQIEMVAETVTPEPVPPQPKPIKEEVAKPQPAPQPAKQIVTQKVNTAPAADAHPTEPTHSSEAPAPLTPAAPVTPAKAVETPAPSPQPAPPAPAAASTDASLADKIRQLVIQNKAYPTGREVSLQKPEGSVEVCMTLARSGELLDSAVRESSGSILLDQAAKRLISRLRYPAFDDNAFKGQAQHEFCVRLQYEVPKN